MKPRGLRRPRSWIDTPETGAGRLIRGEPDTAAMALETARNRLLATGLMFALAFLVIAGRLVDLTLLDQQEVAKSASGVDGSVVHRGEIFDRNGMLLATSLPTASLFADATEVSDPIAAAAALHEVMPYLDKQWLISRLTQPSRFVWIRRNLGPDEEHRVSRLGIPGLGFRREYRRVYPYGRQAAHVLGLANVDGQGIAGIEQSYNQRLANGERLYLSLDMRVQHLLREELEATQREFRAIGAAGLILDVHTGEIIALVSLPDFDPNNPGSATEEARFNRVTKGVYEPGSIFKLFTVAMALDTGTTTLERGYDASRPIQISRFTISDYHPQARWLSTAEILVHSSNIGSALMAVHVGGATQRQYLQRFGLFGRARIDLPEVGESLVPNPWREINTMTVGFGHGMATTPIQIGSAVAAIVNGGVLRPATLIAQDGVQPVAGERVISLRTSKQVQALMRMVVQYGTATRADVPGYSVGGKTGTAEKLVNGHYRKDQRISSFVGAFPMDAPRYVVIAILDDPKGNRSTYNYATGGWVAAPCVGRLVSRMAPLLGIAPRGEAVAAAGGNKTHAAALTKQQGLAQAIRDAIQSTRGIKQVAAN